MIAAIFLRIFFTAAIFHNLQCFFKDFYQCILFMHQLFQIAGATRNRIRNYKILFSIICIRYRDFAYSSPQMVHISGKQCLWRAIGEKPSFPWKWK